MFMTMASDMRGLTRITSAGGCDISDAETSIKSFVGTWLSEVERLDAEIATACDAKRLHQELTQKNMAFGNAMSELAAAQLAREEALDEVKTLQHEVTKRDLKIKLLEDDLELARYEIRGHSEHEQ